MMSAKDIRDGLATGRDTGDPAQKLWTFGRVLQLIATLGFWTAAIFVSAGTVRWVRGWICVAATLATYAVCVMLVQLKNPTLMNARANWRHHDTKSFDKVFVALVLPLYFAQPLVAGLDVVRFRWTSMPWGTVYVGMFLLVLGIGLVTWAMSVNPFAEPTVRIQFERQQYPITSGPYSLVRHPMYVGAILMFPATGLMFGSVVALAIGVLLAILFVWRTAKEDEVLRHELPGYEEFAAVTRYRLLPGMW
jgi:protein-S-isoprenylcysteine O-methyltransferase Ste14